MREDDVHSVDVAYEAFGVDLVILGEGILKEDEAVTAFQVYAVYRDGSKIGIWRTDWSFEDFYNV